MVIIITWNYYCQLSLLSNLYQWIFNVCHSHGLWFTFLNMTKKMTLQWPPLSHLKPEQISELSVVKLKMSWLAQHAAEPICWHRLYRRKAQNLLQGAKQEEWAAQLLLKRPKLPDGFQGRIFKVSTRSESHRLISLWTFFRLVGGAIRVIFQES